MDFTIYKAVAIRRWDIIVNGVTIVSRDTKAELTPLIARWKSLGYLRKEL